MDNDAAKFSIAIDGTAASGKSTVARMLSERLGCSYLDTGKLYRALALDFLRRLPAGPEGWEEDGSGVAERLGAIDLKIESPPSGECRILLHNEDVNEQLADLKVEKATPFAARLAEVREFLLEVQRALAREKSVVMAGRDIGTVVLPRATLKVFIEADLRERARRRLAQHRDGFTEDELRRAADDLRRRDHRDANREHAPMAVAPDALRLDSTHRTADELTSEIVTHLKRRLALSGSA